MTIAIERTIRVWSTPDFSQMPVEDRPIPDNAMRETVIHSPGVYPIETRPIESSGR